jgi:hypothetical protein
MVAQHAEYRRFEPPTQLRHLVEHAWVTHHGQAPTREVVLPDGRGLLLVVHGTPASVRDPLAGITEIEGTSVRGLALRVGVRTQAGPTTRLGVQLTPVALARLRPGRAPLATAGDAAELIDAGDLAAAQGLLAAGRDVEAVERVLTALGAAPCVDGDEIDRLSEVLARAEHERGLVRSGELARRAGVPLNELHRWFVHLLGVDPAAWLSAVRFAAFVRESVGRSPVTPAVVLAAITWYSQAGYPPREVERFSGLPPVELRRLVDKLAAELEAA